MKYIALALVALAGVAQGFVAPIPVASPKTVVKAAADDEVDFDGGSLLVNNSFDFLLSSLLLSTI